jgi:hypothetical protein
MAVIFWAVGGVVAGAVLHDDHSAHSDYDNYGNYSDYSDYAERQRRRLNSLKSDTESAAQELSGYKRSTVNPELTSKTLKETKAMRVSESDMNGDVTGKINRQIEHDETCETSDLKNELKLINELMKKIEYIERSN